MKRHLSFILPASRPPCKWADDKGPLRMCHVIVSDGFLALAGKKVLVVEDEEPIAAEIIGAVRDAGGIVVGPVPTRRAPAFATAGTIEAAVIDVRLWHEAPFPVVDHFRSKGIAVHFVAGDDDWLLPESCDEPLVFRSADDAANIVRVRFPQI